MAKRSILPPEVLTKETKALVKTLSEESDLAVVLVGTSYVDACLAAVLASYMIESSVTSRLLAPQTGVLGSLAARADICYCLGLIHKMAYSDMRVMAEIRNQFAHHHLALDFATPEVVALCAKLAFAVSPHTGVLMAPFFHRAFEKPRYRFVMSAVTLSQTLLNIAKSMSRVPSKC